MHGTRTTVTMLAGMAVAALSGCVAVEPPPAAPAPAPRLSAETTGQDVAPQIVQGPAREALEAAMPDPTPEPRSSVERHKEGTTGGGDSAGRRRAEKPRSSAVPKQQRRHPDVELPELPQVPRGRDDVCELGERYGGWHPGSDQARLCRGAYGKR
ncbi:hypothetical protein ACFY7C_15705 [Streptomyces sp. NPDC012769]|uniref:hypothetical protein n=1 Tax=Streptomyces sp. NPDC012769 TaxID=3364848 RepID=UPI00367540EA